MSPTATATATATKWTCDGCGMTVRRMDGVPNSAAPP